MKKIICAIALAVMTAVGASAQSRDMAVGINLGVAPVLEKGIDLNNFGLGAKFQYNITANVRLEADVDYWFKSKGLGVFDIMANAHYLFNIGDNFRIYPIVGIGYAYLHSSFDGLNRFAFNLGAGAEYDITNHIAACLELKYQYMSDFQRLPISVGVAYKF